MHGATSSERIAAVTRATTSVMSCKASVVVVGDAVDPTSAVERLHQLERRWSRFLPDSEVSKLNRSGGCPQIVSSDTARLIEAMVEAWHLTRGAYDPTLLRSIVEAGYRTSRTDSSQHSDVGAEVQLRGRPDEIRLDRTAGVVQLPVGTAIDPGGIGKGLAADIVVEELLAAGAAGALVEVGGDLAVSGCSPPGDGWTIAVAESSDLLSPPVTICLTSGGVATSTTRRRRWTTDGVERHHLIDPATMECSTRSVRTSTVVAGSAAIAEAFAKVPFSAPLDETLATLDHHRLAARLQLNDRSHRTSTAWGRFALESRHEMAESTNGDRR